MLLFLFASGIFLINLVILNTQSNYNICIKKYLCITFSNNYYYHQNFPNGTSASKNYYKRQEILGIFSKWYKNKIRKIYRLN